MAALILFLFVFRSILLPFLAGMILAYFLDPVADRLERLGMSRLLATILILILFVIALVIGLVIVIPILATQLADFLVAPARIFRAAPGALTRSTLNGCAATSASIRRACARGSIRSARGHGLGRDAGRVDLEFGAGRSSTSPGCSSSRPSSPSTCCSTGTRWSSASTARAAQQCRDGSPDRARHRRGGGGLRARAGHAVPDPGRLSTRSA